MKLKDIAKFFTKLAAEETKLEQALLPDGTVIEADSFEEGASVFMPTEDGEMIPLPEGSYELDNGMVITVDANGVIVSVGEATPEGGEDPVTEPTAAPEAELDKDKPVKKTVESNTVSKETFFSQEDVDKAVETALAKQKEELDTKIAELSVQVQTLSTEKADLEKRLEDEPATKPLKKNPEGKKTSPEEARLQSARPQSTRNRILQRIQEFN